MPDDLYVCVDDEGNKFLYQGSDTFIRMAEGAEKDRWMTKLSEGKVRVHPVAGMVVCDIATGEQNVKLFDGWEFAGA